VQVKNTTRGTATDGSGKFIIQASPGEVLAFSYVGYTSSQVSLTDNSSLTVSLSADTKVLQDLLIVGSRNVNRTELNTPVAVDVIQFRDIQRTSPQYDVTQMLTYNIPSFQSNRQSASDGSEHIDPAAIRGLGPDQTLVLINGKRRHTTSLLNNQGSLGVGSVGTDLNAIPVAAIERIEVLRDGAAAQYGSDAIAGVVNVVLKKNTGQLNTYVGGGLTSRGDGEYFQVNSNYGFGVGKKGGYINLTGDYSFRGTTNRTSNHDLIIFDQSELGNFFAYDFADDPVASRQFDDRELAARGLTRDDFNFRIGDAQTNNLSFFYNLSIPYGRDNRGELYSFAGLSYREGRGNGFRRLPSETSNVVPDLYPNGFQPNTTSQIWDRSIVVGSRYKFKNEWRLDLSNTFGNNRFDYGVTNTNNASLGINSPTEFEAGGHAFSQNTINLDVSRFYKNILSGFNLAFGSEFRIDQYKIQQGEEASWRNYAFVTSPDGTVSNPSGLSGGAQSFNGFTPLNAVNASRTNFGMYADSELDVTTNWTVGLAGRYENYSDFGSALIGKITTRYAITKALAIRAAANTGFRAPSLHQQYFSYVSTNILPSGALGQSGIFRNTDPIARSLGIPELKEERSQNASVGFTFNPSPRLNLAVDGYLITVQDRIVLTGSFGQDAFGGPVPETQTLLLPFGAETASFLTNGINTETRGVDIVATYNLPINNSALDFTLAANYNKTQIVGDLNISDQLIGQEDIFLSPAGRASIETGRPRNKAVLGINYSTGKLNVLVRNTYFGKVIRDGFPFGEIQELTPKLVTDLSLSYNFTNTLGLTIGANNLFDVFPDVQIYPNSYFGVFKYAPEQMGMTGAFYFARLNVKLNPK
jgi:iron complex outermembrane receptor protein